MKLFHKPRLTVTFLVSVILLTTVSYALVGYIWISHQYEQFHGESLEMKATYIRNRKRLFRKEVEQVIDYINYTKSLTNSRLQQNLRERVYEAHAIASNLYRQNRGRKTDAEIKKMIKEALRPIRFNKDRGYFFAGNFNGVEQLFPDKPELEGKNLIKLKDTEGRFVIQDMIALVKENSEGFYRYSWTKPNQEGRSFPKLSFVKHFEPFDWFIGTGEYLDDFKKDIQQEVLKRISKIRYENEGYIFAGQWDGLTLLGPGKGKNMLSVTDENGVKIVQELIEASRYGGGYVHYVLPKFKGLRSSPKISYASGIKDWQWYVGTGQFVDEIDETIRENEKILQEQVKEQVINITLLLFGILAVISLWMRYLFKKTRRNFQQFSDFFAQAIDSSLTIDTQKLGFAEFTSLAESVNQMVALRKKAEDDLKTAHANLEIKVNERTRELKRAMEGAEAANKAKSEFLANISHELRNPIHQILSYSKYGVEKIKKVPTSKLEHYFRQIRKSGGRLMILLNDLLDLSKMETGKMSYQMTENNLWKIASEAADEFGTVIKDKSLTFRMIEPTAPTRLICDEYRIGQVVRNLLANAFDYTPEGRTVTVFFAKSVVDDTCKIEGIQLSISDQGVGIPNDELHAIFDKFTQSSYTKTGAGGTGLGLAICHEIIESHQGKIWAENNPDDGATFSFIIPFQQN